MDDRPYHGNRKDEEICCQLQGLHACFDLETQCLLKICIHQHHLQMRIPFNLPWHKYTWWRHQMKTFSALLAICAGNSPGTGEFPTQRPVTRSFDVYFDLRPNKRLSKQWWGWWLEMPSHPLWHHRNVFLKYISYCWLSYFIITIWWSSWYQWCRRFDRLHQIQSQMKVTSWRRFVPTLRQSIIWLALCERYPFATGGFL